MTADRTARFSIRRGDRVEAFAVPFEEGATVLDALLWLRAHRDPTLAFRYSCTNANVCKECTIAIDGRVDYACTTRLVADRVMTLAPLPGKKLLRDLVTDTVPPRERLG